jgi:GNAT superfamily N-acetyltransferase
MEISHNLQITYSSDLLTFSYVSLERNQFQKTYKFQELIHISPIFSLFNNLHNTYNKLHSKLRNNQICVNRISDSILELSIVFIVDEDQFKVNIPLHSCSNNLQSQDMFVIKHATKEDTPLVLSLIKELAEYQKLAHTVKNNEEDIKKVIFGEGDEKRAEALIGYYNNLPVASVIFFYNYSSFTGRPGIYVEDIYVKSEYRKHGFGRRMMSYLAKMCRKNNYSLIQWSVLDWNETAIKFYKSLGASPVEGWISFILSDDALISLAENTG